MTAAALSPLTPAQWVAFKRDGCVMVPGFFSRDEVRALQAEVKRLQSANLLHNVCTDGDGVTQSTTAMNLQLCPAHPHSPLIRALPFSDKVTTAIGALLGEPSAVYLDQIFLKPAGNGAGTGWHTDNAYFHSHEVERGTGMWIAVHDATTANGTMAVIPGSHRRSLPHRRDGDSDHHITCADHVSEAEAVLCELAAGGVVFFNWGIAHRTGPNATAADRAGLAYHFVHADGLPPLDIRRGDSLHADPVVWINGPACDGGCLKHGSDQRGRFDDLVRASSASG